MDYANLGNSGLKVSRICLGMCKKFPIIVVVIVCLFTACSQGGGSEEAALMQPAVAPTNTPAAPSPTEKPPTATEIPFTATPIPPTDVSSSSTPIPPTDVPSSPTPIPPTVAPANEPVVALQEVIAAQTEDIVGTWDSLQGYQMIIGQSGGVRIRDSEMGEEMVGVGTYHFENDQLILDSEVCLKWEGGFAIEFACSGIYTVYVVKEVDEAAGLRFELIDDPYRDRRIVMTKYAWQQVEE